MRDEFLKRQSESGAIVNTDLKGLEAYRLRKQAAKSQLDRINNLEAKIENLSEDIGTILRILQGKAND